MKDPQQAEYWQREADRYSGIAEHSAGRVYVILSFGLGAVSAIVAAGLISSSAPLLAFGPVAGVFMLALIVTSTMETLYASAHQRLAEERSLLLVGGPLADEMPAYGRGPRQPAKLQQLNAIAWAIGVGSFLLLALAVEIASHYLDTGPWSALRTPIGTVSLFFSQGVLLVGVVLIGIYFFRAWNELLAFLAKHHTTLAPSASAPAAPRKRNK